MRDCRHNGASTGNRPVLQEYPQRAEQKRRARSPRRIGRGRYWLSHYERREYAERLYTDLINAKESGFDYYANMREHFIDERNFERATYGRAEIIKGFERDTLAEVSQNLGHNRISVVYYSYLNIA